MWVFIGYGLAIGAGVGIVLGIIIVVPSFIYCLPYMTWLGWNQGTKGIPRKLPSDKLPPAKNWVHTVSNSTKLYRSWITHQPHNITNW